MRLDRYCDELLPTCCFPSCNQDANSEETALIGRAEVTVLPQVCQKHITKNPPPPTHTHTASVGRGGKRWKPERLALRIALPQNYLKQFSPKWETSANRKRRNSGRCQKPNPTHFWMILSKTSQAYSIIGERGDDGSNNCLGLRKLNKIIHGKLWA